MHVFSPLDLWEGRDAIQDPFKNTMFNVKKKSTFCNHEFSSLANLIMLAICNLIALAYLQLSQINEQ